MSEPDGLSDADVALAQALADVNSIAIVQDQATRDAVIREGHLQHALDSRIVIDQAKGVLDEAEPATGSVAIANGLRSGTLRRVRLRWCSRR